MASRADTLKAFRLSIRKWKGLARGIGVDDGCTNCALCILCKGRQGCAECPVCQYSGHGLCRHTPYDGWLGAVEEYSEGCSHTADTRKARNAARKEYEFLVWLRDRWRRRNRP